MEASITHVQSIIARFYDTVSAGGDITVKDRLRFRVDQVRATDRAIEAVRMLSADVGIPPTLGDIGVDPGAIPEMAKAAMSAIDAPTNPRHFTEEDIVTLYRRSFGMAE